MQATESVRSLATENYNTAAKKFITREFRDSWEILKPLMLKSNTLVASGEISPRTRVKIWLLYAALQESGTVPSQKIDFSVLNSGYDNLGQIDPEVILAISKLVSKSGNYQHVLRSIEEYISLKPALNESDIPVVQYLVLEVLPSMDEFNYAREFTEMCQLFNTQTRLGILKELECKQVKVLQNRQKERELLIAQEKQEKDRVERAKSRAAQEAEEDASSSLGIVPRQRTLSPRNDSKSTSVYKRQPLPTIWKEWAKNLVRNRGLANALIILLLLLTLASSLRLRAKATKVGEWIWQGAKQAIKMGMTVTYF